MSKRWQLGIIGCGDIAGYVAQLARLNRHLSIAACADAGLPGAESFARRHGIGAAYGHYRALLEHAGLDAVYIATPHYLHEDMAVDAIEAGLPVWLEKPITHSMEEAHRVVSTAEAHEIKVGVNYQYRYDRGMYALAQAAQTGLLGDLRYARINVPWRRDPDYFKLAPWRAQLAQSGGGTLLTQGSHLLDAVLWALGSRPVSAMGRATRRVFVDVEVEDLAMGVVEMASGALIAISSSMIAEPEQALRVELYGSRGTAIYTNQPWPRVQFRGVSAPRYTPPAPGIHALARSLEGFRRWCVEGEPYLTPAAEALPVLAVVEAIYRSAISGQVEPVAGSA